MAMNVKTWWNINVHLLSDSGKIKGTSTFGMTMAMSFHTHLASLCQVQLGVSDLFS